MGREEIEDNERFVLVEREATDWAYRDMEEFVGTVTNPALRERLAGALAGKGVFGRFRRTLAETPNERDRWFAFRGARLEERARAWLAEIGVKLRGL